MLIENSPLHSAERAESNKIGGRADFITLGRMAELHTYRDDPANPGATPDTTTWNYHAATGLLIAKVHADGNGTVYSYTPEGQLASRLWARGASTTYTYDPATGELTNIAYSDDTAPISFAYDRLGRQTSVSDAAGARQFAYDPATLAMTSETLPADFYGARSITRSHDNLGRSTGFALSPLPMGEGQGEGTAPYSVSYDYDDFGRFTSLDSHAGQFNYAYLANSNLVSTLSTPSTLSTFSHEPNRNLIAQVENSAGAATISNYSYTNDPIGRRTARAHSGTAFTAPDTISYSYNSRSEVTAATAANDPAYAYNYNFDPIGNRLSSQESGQTLSYATNNVNQYTSIDDGSAPVSPTYDQDGNMLILPPSPASPLSPLPSFALTYNAENRLVAAESADKRLEFSYDYMGRRLEKKVFTGAPGNWFIDSHTKFVYDGFLQIAALDALDANTLAKTRVWEPGGGRLLATVKLPSTSGGGAGGEGGTYYALSDANKNITEYINDAGAIQAHYEYSPFGELTTATGPMADNFDFRFSSEHFDKETGLVYYNYRYHAPNLGRWINRDPIGESGGANLYGFTRNRPTNAIDILGLICKWYYTDDQIVEKGECENLEFVETLWTRDSRSWQVDIIGPNDSGTLIPRGGLFSHTFNFLVRYKGTREVKTYNTKHLICCGIIVWTSRANLLASHTEPCTKEDRFTRTYRGPLPYNDFRDRILDPNNWPSHESHPDPVPWNTWGGSIDSIRDSANRNQIEETIRQIQIQEQMFRQ